MYSFTLIPYTTNKKILIRNLATNCDLQNILDILYINDFIIITGSGLKRR